MPPALRDSRNYDQKSHDKNVVKVPENLANRVLKTGHMDYRPAMGGANGVVAVRSKTSNSMCSFFKSGKSLNKGMKEWNTKAL